jgi:beta-glucosidase
VEQLPAFTDYSMNGRTYRYFTGDPLYGFGFGLTYSHFQYSNLRAQRTGTGAQITVRVKNDSTRDGDEVVQVYTNGSAAIRSLRAFERIHLRAGETRDVKLALSEIPKAKITATVGGSQHGIETAL